MSYGKVATERQGEIIRGMAASGQVVQSEADHIAEAVFRRFCDSGVNIQAK
jgi:hypothetical protein